MRELVKSITALLLCAGIVVTFSGCTEPTHDYPISIEIVSAADIETDTAITEDTSYQITAEAETAIIPAIEYISLSDIPTYSGEAYAVINDNVPFFSRSDLTERSFESYSDLDDMGRCGVAYACIGKDIMPIEERGSIGSIKPTGWHTVKYDNVDGKYLYNRCHLIGYQLSGENANERNLITGTRYLNIEGMLPFENMTADYVNETGNHVLYRVTPMFDGDDLLASGVLMEGYSVEDSGAGICFNVFCYNVQPDIAINYANGESEFNENVTVTQAETTVTEIQTSTLSEITYIVNTNTKKFHYPSCPSVEQMSVKNKMKFIGDREELIAEGYSSCGKCDP